jgi:haloalkane dehalogenase
MKTTLLVIILSLTSMKSFSQTHNLNTMDSLKSYNKSLYPFESKWMEIDGNRIHYIDEGDGQPIVFSHAVIGSSFMYREFVKELRGDYRVIIMDFPGFGLSQQSADYEFTFVQQARVFQRFIDRLQLSEIILVGHDSPSGLLVAVWKPDLFKGFILTDTQIFPSDEYKRIHKLLNMAGGRFFSGFNTATNFLTWGTMRFGMPTKKFTKAEKQEYYKMSKGKVRRQAPGKILKSIRTEREAMVQLRTAFETSLSQKPVLMIYGVNDPVNRLGIPERMKKMLPNSELHLIEGEKHFPHEGQAKLMSLIMYKWLRKRAF